MTDQLTIAEFCGLFWGEGCADIQRFHRPNYPYPLYRPRLRITMAENETALLKAVCDLAGGYLSFTRSSAHVYRFVNWQLTKRDQVVQVCDWLLDGRLPGSKKVQVHIVKQAALRNLHPGTKLGAEGRDFYEAQYQALRALKDVRL